MAPFTPPLALGDVVTSPDQIADQVIQNQHIVNLSADKITAGTIDASKITVINLNATNITSGTLTAITINGGAAYNDTLGTFYPLTVNSGGNLTFNSSQNHVTSVVLHDTDTVASDLRMYRLIGGLVFDSASAGTNWGLTIADRTPVGAGGLYNAFQFNANTRTATIRTTNGALSQYVSSDVSGNITLWGALSGNATTATTATTATNATKLNSEKLQHGNVTGISVGAAPASASGSVTFGSGFSGTPDVVAGMGNTSGSVDMTVFITSTSTSGFNWVVWASSGAAATCDFRWIACGTA